MNLVKLEGYRITIQKPVAFLYSNNKLSKKELRKIIKFITMSKRIKYLDINLTNEMEDLYTENYKMLLKEIKEDLNNKKTFQVHKLEDSKTLRWYYFLLILICRYNIIPIKILTATLVERGKLILKLIWKFK
jgi:hypothetical protein